MAFRATAEHGNQESSSQQAQNRCATKASEKRGKHTRL
jgi:hypothetical protein